MKIEIPYALDASGQLVHIDQVRNGYECGCICPSCGSKLNARNGGETRVHHFAHISSAVCSNPGETVLHLLSKKILSEASEILLPIEKYYETVIQPERVFRIGSAKMEKAVDNFIPDVTLISNTGEEVYIEVKVTHEVDQAKLKKIRHARINCAEIDLSGFEKRLFDQDLIDNLKTKLLLSPSDYTWLYSRALQRFSETKHDNKIMINRTLFDKDTFLQLEYNERLTWRSSLDRIWINNNCKPFIASTRYKNRHYAYYFLEDPKKQDKKYGCVFGYACKIIGDDFKTVGDSWGQYFYYECTVVEESKKRIFNPFKNEWYFDQDQPDEIIDEEKLALIKKAREEKQIQKQKNEEYQQELRRKTEMIESNTKATQFDVFSTNPFPRTAGELLKVFGDTANILVLNKETGEIVTVSDALKYYLDDPEKRAKRIWSYYDRTN